MAQDFNVWEGIYRSFGDLPSQDSAFTSERWLESQSEPFRNLPGAEFGRPDVLNLAKMHDYIFPAIVAVMLEIREKVRILDFGGGLGSRLLEVLGSVPSPDRVDAMIIDSTAICEKGNVFFKNRPGVRFSPDLPMTSERFDIVHCGSSLHYVEDWFGMICRFRAYQPRYVLLSDIPVGDIPTFVTAQSYYGHRIPVWMWNREEFLEKLSSIGFSVLFDCAYVAGHGGPEGRLPMMNMPKTHRLDHTRHLLFSHGIEANVTGRI